MNWLLSRRAGIARKIVLMTCLVAAISVTIFAIFMTRHYRLQATAESDRQATRIAEAVKTGCAGALARNDLTSVVEFCLERVGDWPDLVFVNVIRSDGLALMHTPEGWREEQLGIQPETVDGQDGGQSGSVPWLSWLTAGPKLEVRVRREPIMAGGKAVGRVEVGMSLEQNAQDQIMALSMTGRVGGITLILAAALAYFSANGVTRPVRELQLYAQRVAGGALNARVSIGSEDEIGDLADSINRMVQNLDVSQRQLRESLRSQAALREKEILLREIHHRVKNNMQILSSLLRLQSRRADSAELREVLQESEARIRSMGLLHEKLYQSESVSTIEMRGYLQTLTGEVARMNAGRAGVKPEIQIRAHHVALGIDTALPCGLIVTELVSNAFKYAFAGVTNPIILVSVSRADDGEFHLVVWDNGRGIPAEVDLAKCQSLGLRLVRLLTDQLNGQLSISGAKGTRVEVRFKESQYKNRF